MSLIKGLVEKEAKGVAVRACKPPRKIRMDSIPDRPTWVAIENGYKLETTNLYATLIFVDKWQISAIIKKQKYTGTRDTLEEAFKALDRLISKYMREIWVIIDCRAVMSPWMGDLNNL
jgi:hypothetical protein